jgi:hypothetical protein
MSTSSRPAVVRASAPHHVAYPAINGRRHHGWRVLSAPPALQPLPEFRCTATSRPSPELLDLLNTFVVEQYLAGLSLRQIAELTDRSFSGVRRILATRGVRRWPAGAAARLRLRALAVRRRRDLRRRAGRAR